MAANHSEVLLFSDGKWCGNNVLGYNLVEIKGSEYKKRNETEIVINKSEAEIIKMIFNEYVNGIGVLGRDKENLLSQLDKVLNSHIELAPKTHRL